MLKKEDIKIRYAKNEDSKYIRDILIETIDSIISKHRQVDKQNLIKGIKKIYQDINFMLKQKNLHVLVAEYKNEVIGFLILITDLIDDTTLEKQAMVFHYAVKKKYQGNIAVSFSLIRQAENIAKQKGNKYIIGYIIAENKTSLKISQYWGYKIEKYQVIKQIT